jgi:hypothetical protein
MLAKFIKKSFSQNLQKTIIIKPFTKTISPKIPLDFKDNSNTPIHLNKDSLFFGVRLTSTFLYDSLPLIAYYGITIIGGPFLDPLFHHLTLFCLLGYPVYKCSQLIKVYDVTVKELHICKNGKELVAVLDKGFWTSNKIHNSEPPLKGFKPNYRHSKRVAMFVKFDYGDIEKIEKKNIENEVFMLVRIGPKTLLEMRLDLNNHDEEIPLEYIVILINQRKISTI